MATVEVWRGGLEHTVCYRDTFPKPEGQYLDYAIEDSTVEEVEVVLPILLRPGPRGAADVPCVGTLRECRKTAELDALLESECPS